jgi:hypothetical protein
MQDRGESGREEMGAVKSYYVGPVRRAIIPVFLVGLVVVLLTLAFLSKDFRERYAFCMTALTLAIIMSPFILVVYYTRLWVSPEGVEVRQLGWRVATTWDNILELRMERYAEGLVLRNPLAGRGQWALRLGTLIPGWYKAAQYELVKKGLWFPLDPFAWYLRHGDLAAQIRQYAPALVTDVAPSEAKSEPRA